jgi:hypothetical protein
VHSKDNWQLHIFDVGQRGMGKVFTCITEVGGKTFSRVHQTLHNNKLEHVQQKVAEQKERRENKTEEIHAASEIPQRPLRLIVGHGLSLQQSPRAQVKHTASPTDVLLQAGDALKRRQAQRQQPGHLSGGQGECLLDD